MSDERWQELLSSIEEKFEVEEQGTEEIREEGGGEVAFIIFNGPLGRMKLERTTRPMIIDKKTSYSNRIGSEVKVDYVFSPTEKSHKLRAYRWDEARNDWNEIEMSDSFKL